MFGEKKKQLQQAAKEAAAAAAAGANAEASANFSMGSTPNGAATQSFQSMHGASLGLTNDPDQYMLNSRSRPPTQKKRVHRGFQQLLKKEHVGYTPPSLPLWECSEDSQVTTCSPLYPAHPTSRAFYRHQQVRFVTHIWVGRFILVTGEGHSDMILISSAAGMLLHDFSPQNAGLFGHHPMLGGGMPGEFHDSKNSVLGLNLVPSDFSQGGAGSVHPQQLQQSKDPYYVQSKQSDSPDKSTDNRPGSPAGSAEQSDDQNAGDVVKVEKNAEMDKEQPLQNDTPTNNDDAQATKENDTMADKSSEELRKREPKKISQDERASKSAKSDDILDASPTKAAPTSESRAPSTTSEPQSSSSVDSDKRPRSEVLGAASTSPHKRQRVVV
ncbi:unnamed protein product [Phytophthora fragariaefolia]|uniref:Unnamed protein product n=1 Tax=Phytophthora fragariaefolia TaxID=1490495 RepID=A0A9W6XN58_9STRA|nr:unnamed protein product [Phytophthora fragariaefolia]